MELHIIFHLGPVFVFVDPVAKLEIWALLLPVFWRRWETFSKFLNNRSQKHQSPTLNRPKEFIVIARVILREESDPTCVW